MPHLSNIVRFDSLLMLSGQIGTDADGALPEGIDTQTRQCLANIAAALGSEGAGLEAVLKTTVFLTRRSDYLAFDTAYAETFGTHMPARSTVIADLAIEGALVEIEAIARAVRR